MISTWSFFEISHSQTNVVTLNFFNSFSNSSSLFFLLATKIIIEPNFANSIAVCLPIPDDAPVIKTTLFLKSINKKNSLMIKWFLFIFCFWNFTQG